MNRYPDIIEDFLAKQSMPRDEVLEGLCKLYCSCFVHRDILIEDLINIKYQSTDKKPGDKCRAIQEVADLFGLEYETVRLKLYSKKK